MIHHRTSRLAYLVRTMFVGMALAVWCMPVFGQAGGGGGGAGGGGGGGGGGGAGGGGAGGGGAGGGTGGGGGTTGGTTGSGSLVFGYAGTSSSGVTSTGSTTISSLNPFYSFYANPMSAGYAANVTLTPQNTLSLSAGSAGTANSLLSGKGLLGSAEYKTTTTTAKINNGITAMTSTGTAAVTTQNAGYGFNTIGVKRAPAYTTTISPDMMIAAPPPAQFQAELQSSLGQTLPSAQNVRVSLASIDNQSVVVLQGTVATDRDRRLAENVLRLTPGVRLVRNDIVVATAK